MATGKVNNLLGTGYKSEKLVASLRCVKSMLIQVKINKGKTRKRLMKEIAQCLANGMDERVRTKVLSLIREEKLIHAMDSLEYHCDVVIQHIALLAKHLDPNLAESVSTLVYAAVRLGTEVTELKTVYEQLSGKYGKELCHMWKLNQAGTVNQVIVEKLSTDHPSKELVDKYLSDIVKQVAAAADTYQSNDQYETADDIYAPYSQYESPLEVAYQSYFQYEVSKPNVHQQTSPQRPLKTETYEPNAQERRRSMAVPPTPNRIFSGRTYYNVSPTTSPLRTNPANTVPGNVPAGPTNENTPVQPPELRTIPILIGEDSIPFNTKELYLIAVVPSPEEIYNMYSDQNPPPVPPRIHNLSTTDDAKSSTYASSGSDYQRWMQHLVKVVPISKPLFEDQVTNKSEGDAGNTKAEPVLRCTNLFNL